jgi:hypothetical protein
MSKQNTPPIQGDEVASSQIPWPTEPRIVPIRFEAGIEVDAKVINTPTVPT